MKQKPDLPDPSGPLKEAVPRTAIAAAANVKVTEAFNETEVKKSASRTHESNAFLTSAQKHEVTAYDTTFLQ